MIPAVNMDRPGDHVPDGVILSLLDGEVPVDGARATEHLKHCVRCATRLDELRRDSATFSGLLEEIDVGAGPMEAARARSIRQAMNRKAGYAWLRPLLRVAAGIVLAAGIASATPLGEVVSRTVRGILSDQNLFRRAPVPPAATGATTTGAATVIRFLPASDTIVIRFDHRPAAGTLTLSPSNDGQVAVQVANAESTEELLILPGVLSMRNSPMATASYAVEAPIGMRVVIVAGPDTLFADRVEPTTHRIPLVTDREGQH